jgi:hypothetical protein
VTSLSVLEHDIHAVGKLAAFLHRVRPHEPIAVVPLYNTLYGELRRKANYEKKGLDFGGLLRLKGISRDQFTRLLTNVKEEKKFEREWPSIKSLLGSEGVGFVELIQIGDACRRYEIERMERRNLVLVEMAATIKQATDSIMATSKPEKLSEGLNQCVTHGRSRRIKGTEIYTDPYLKAIAIFHLYEY